MTTQTPRMPQHRDDDADEFEPGMLPVEPDQGLVPALIPHDPEGERMLGPYA